MSLAELIRRKKSPAAIATAISAIPATDGVGFAGTVATIATVAVATPARTKNDDGNSSKRGERDTACSPSWLLHFSDRNPLEVHCSLVATHAEILEQHSGAVAAEPFAQTVQQTSSPLTYDAETAIRAWLAQIGETDEATIDEVLTRGRNDSAARAYYLGRARYAETNGRDDRRSCHQCNELRFGVCIIAKPGGLVSATRGYRPAAPEMLRRCDGYAPRIHRRLASGDDCESATACALLFIGNGKKMATSTAATMPSYPDELIGLACSAKTRIGTPLSPGVARVAPCSERLAKTAYAIEKNRNRPHPANQTPLKFRLPRHQLPVVNEPPLQLLRVRQPQCQRIVGSS